MKPYERLGEYFTYGEAVATQHRRIDNTPSDATLRELIATAAKMDRVRAFLGHPVLVSSWYRSPALNSAVGGAKNSAHIFGQAVDFTCPRAGNVREVVMLLRGAGIRFDQMIEENPKSASGGWVHLSFRPPLRGQILSFNGERYTLRTALAVTG